MPSYTDEQKRRAVDMVEECGGSVTRALRKLGYPTRQTLYQWLNRRDASHERRAGRPWSHYDPALKGAGRGAREVGHGRQGRRRDAGGVERRGGLQLGQSRRRPEPRGGGQESHRL